MTNAPTHVALDLLQMVIGIVTNHHLTCVSYINLKIESIGIAVAFFVVVQALNLVANCSMWAAAAVVLPHQIKSKFSFQTWCLSFGFQSEF